jgi:hypothetical protein
MASELSLRVLALTLAAVLPLAALASWLGGGRAGFGLLAAAALTGANFFWLSHQLPTAGAAADAQRRRLGWVLSAGLRFGVLMMALAALLLSEWAHPLAVVAGLTVLPCAVVAAGLLASRGSASN